jgi:hypothetical protein
MCSKKCVWTLNAPSLILCKIMIAFLKSAYTKIYNKFNQKIIAKHDALKENLYKFYNSSKHLSRKEIFDRFIEIQDECLRSVMSV